MITGKNRSLCTDLAAANHYTDEHLKSEKVWAHVKAATLYYVGGFHLTVSPPAAEALGKHALENNKAYALGLGAPFIPLAFGEQLKSLLQYADYVIGADAEAETFAQANGMEDKKGDPQFVARKLCAGPKHNSKRGRVVVITCGTEPTVVAESGDAPTTDESKVKVTTYPVHAIGQDEICDTNGAGDAFAGGFLAGLVEGRSLRECVDMGQWLARLSLRELGPS